ncbi:uncharacterized protein LOC143848619 isoform X2 [Tasmannia lanceolata]
MNSLGLPLSFSTNREKRTVPFKENRKSQPSKPVHSHKLTEKCVSPVVSHDSTSTINGQSETSQFDFGENGSEWKCLFGERDSEGQNPRLLSVFGLEQFHKEITGVMTKCSMNLDIKPDNISSVRNTRVAVRPIILDAEIVLGNALQDISSGPHQEESHTNLVDVKSLEPSQSSGCLEHELRDECDTYEHYGDLSDWTVFWDDFYKRNYFFNFRTDESTWYPPPGMEYLAYSESGAESNEVNIDSDDKNDDLESACDGVNILDICGLRDKADFSQDVEKNDRLSCEPLQTVISEKEYHDESLQNIVNQLGSEEVWQGDPQLTFMNSKTDELDVCEPLDRSEGYISCKETEKPLNDALHQVQAANSSTYSPIEVSYEETWRSDMQTLCMSTTTDELDNHHNLVSIKKKKKLRRTLSQKKIPSSGNKGFTASIAKYWWQRYVLFSKFDDGVKMDEEGWFSVTPESIARHHASRCGNGTIVDCFTGVGGNAIQFATRSNHVIAIDIDPQKIDYAQHNATIYGVNDSIDFIKGDLFHLAPKLKGFTAFMSPPWGGPDYAKVQTYDINTMLKPRDGHFLFKTARGIASRIIMFLPRNVDFNQLAELSLSVQPPWALEVEKNFLNGKLKAITAYFTDTSV